jgi:hypothetical protein
MSQNPIPSATSHLELPFPFSFVVRPRPRLAWIIQNRWVTLAAAIVGLSIFLGCMSCEVNSHCVCSTEPDGTTSQEGETTLQPREERDIFYFIPYAYPPNLEVSAPWNEGVIVEQKEDHFRVRNKDLYHCSDVKWKARGIRADKIVKAVPMVPPIPLSVPPVPSPTLTTSKVSPVPLPEIPLPPEPIPIAGKS